MKKNKTRILSVLAVICLLASTSFSACTKKDVSETPADVKEDVLPSDNSEDMTDPAPAEEPGPEPRMLAEGEAGYLPASSVEFKRAVDYGFVAPYLANSSAGAPIKWSEYCEMTAEMIGMISSDLETQFREDAAYALSNKDNMYIYQGGFVLYRAAEFMGINNRQSISRTPGGSAFRDPHFFDGDIFTALDYSGYSGNYDIPEEMIENIYGDNEAPRFFPSILYIYDRTSLISFETLMPIDKTYDEVLTIEDAVDSVIRLYESIYDVADTYWTEKEAWLSDYIKNNPSPEVDKRRSEILESETTIVKSGTYIPGETYTGTAYYVSNNGNDSNNGLSPETAWATLDRICEPAVLRPGDIVFFERGGIYRGILANNANGVTYSAYGTGPKPILTSAAENSADPSLWELYYEKDGMNIWKYTKDLLDCGSIIFDDTTAGFKITAGWSPEGYFINDDGTPFVIEESLVQNLDFFSDDGGKCGGELNCQIGDPMKYSEEDLVWGPLYLRCDEGNPGDLYDDIELCTMAQDPIRRHGYVERTVGVGPECVVDNLCVKYYPMMALSYSRDMIIQNCEICWGGGCSQVYVDGFVEGRAGDGITGCDPHNITIKGNYIHDVFKNGIDMESPSEDGNEFSLSDNLFERCPSINCNFAHAGQHYNMSYFEVSNNIIVGSGTGWGARTYIRNAFYRMDWEWFYGLRIQLVDSFNNCSISNNKFYYPLMFALHLTDSEPNITLEGNEFYYADDSSYFMFWREQTPNGRSDKYHTIEQAEAEEFMKNTFGTE